MGIFLTNLSRVLLTIICIIVLNFISALDIVDDTWSRQPREELGTVGHMITVRQLTVADEQSSVRHGHSGYACRDAFTQLTDAVTQYAGCASQYAMDSRVCERCVDYYLNATSLGDTNFSVHM